MEIPKFATLSKYYFSQFKYIKHHTCISIPVTTMTRITAKAMLAPSYHPSLIPWKKKSKTLWLSKQKFIDRMQVKKPLETYSTQIDMEFTSKKLCELSGNFPVFSCTNAIFILCAYTFTWQNQRLYLCGHMHMILFLNQPSVLFPKADQIITTYIM